MIAIVLIHDQAYLLSLPHIHHNDTAGRAAENTSSDYAVDVNISTPLLSVYALSRLVNLDIFLHTKIRI